MGCKKLTYLSAVRHDYQTSELRIISCRKELTSINTVQNLRRSYLYGFNNYERLDAISGSGNAYDFGSRIYNPRLGKFFSIDPRAKEFPFWSPYLFAANDPIRFIDEDGEGPGDKIKRPKRRKNPKLTNKFNGGGLVGLLGGLKGKFLKHNALTSQRNKNPFIAGSNADGTRRARETDDPLSRNGLERITPPRDETNGVPVEFEPKNPEGKMIVEFDPGEDENGNPVEKTIEIGIMDADGNKTTLNSITTDKPGKLETDFNLKKGQTLFKTETSDQQSVNGHTTSGAVNKKKK